MLGAVTKAVSISDSSTFCFRGFCISYLTLLVEYCLRLNIQNDVLYQVFLVNSIENVMRSRKNVKEDHDAKRVPMYNTYKIQKIFFTIQVIFL